MSLASSPLRLVNSLSRQREEFVPLTRGLIGVYVCGPTVYGPAHLGHAKTAVSFDVLVRWLRARYADHRVRYVQNITDVGHLMADADDGDDKVQAEARRRGRDPMEIAGHWEREYFADMAALANRPPDISPRASGHIPEQIELVERLLAVGAAYEVAGSVYFDVSRFAAYGQLSGRRVQEAEAGTRVAVKEEKRHPADFAVWKAADAGHLMQWNSPWGRGYPGWHLECSAMAMKYLGETIDIHGGGMDLKFPHHEDEIAQSQAATGKPFARYWLHGGLVTINGQKMSKSQGNYITLKELFGQQPIDEARRSVLAVSKAYSPGVLRLLILQNHYASNLDIADANLQAAEAGLAKLMEFVIRVGRAAGADRAAGAVGAAESALPGPPLAEAPWANAAVGQAAAAAQQAMVEALNEDLNTPAAIAALFTLRGRVEPALTAGAISQDDAQRLRGLIEPFGSGILGLWPDTPSGPPTSGHAALTEPLLRLLVEARAALRQPAGAIAKAARKLPEDQSQTLKSAADTLFSTADGIRTQLAELGVTLEDGPAGTTWKLP